MKIKKFLVEEREIIMDEIERFLCIQGISYVKVENEIHCPGLLLRFYEFEEYLKSERLFHQMQEGSMDYLSIETDILFSDPRILMVENQSLRKNKTPEIEIIGGVEEFDQDKKPYPMPKSNKKKQLRWENQRQLQKLK